MFQIEAARLTSKSAKKTVVVFAENKGKLSASAQLVDEGLGGVVRNTLRNSRYQGGMEELAKVTVQADAVTQVLVVGTGKITTLPRRDFWKLGLTIGKQLDAMGVKEASLALGELDDDASTLAAATAILEGMAMGLYRFDDYKEVKEHQQPCFEKLTVLTSTRVARMVEEAVPGLTALMDGTETARRAGDLPPNVANPAYMAEQATKLEKLGVKVQVIDEKEMKKLGLNLILAVGGSAAPEDQPRLVIMTYNGGRKGQKPVALVGKGIMFDTGGYNIKTGGHMSTMKYDMCGAAAVLGTMKALAARKAKVNVVGVMSCAMNMIGQNPFLPDSIYKSYKGLHVEIGNTDAEGRLVLADAIAYTIDKFEPTQLVDLATLTGACVVALGGGYAGLFSTSNPLANALAKAGDDVGERLWRMPVDDFYAAKPKFADVNNDGNPYGGSSTAAVFLKKFADKTPWAHLDIAGVAWQDKVPGIHASFGGATGFGVRLLTQWLESAPAEADAAEAPRRKRGRPARRARVAAAAPAEPAVKRGRGRPRKSAA
jgi:leucyl aminopeptidase